MQHLCPETRFRVSLQIILSTDIPYQNGIAISFSPDIREKVGRWPERRREIESVIDSGVRIGHAHLKVANLERSLAFYGGILGFQLMQRRAIRPLLSAQADTTTISVSTHGRAREGHRHLPARPASIMSPFSIPRAARSALRSGRRFSSPQ